MEALFQKMEALFFQMKALFQKMEALFFQMKPLVQTTIAFLFHGASWQMNRPHDE